MTERRVIIQHARHADRGPHFEPPRGFAPLRLRLAAENATIEVICPKVVIGRHSEADLRLAFPDISRHHCELCFEEGQWRVRDLQSLNGVYVNNLLIREAPLFGGDIVRIGGVQLLVVAGTVVRLTKAEQQQNEKLQQIADAIPSEAPTLPRK